MLKEKVASPPAKNKRQKATHYGSVELMPGVHFECAVLDDARRGFVQKQMVRAIGFGGGTQVALRQFGHHAVTQRPPGLRRRDDETSQQDGGAAGETHGG